MDELVRRLSEGEHPVENDLRPQRTAAALKAGDRRLRLCSHKVHKTRKCEFGVALDKADSDWSTGDFVAASGNIRLTAA